MKIFEAKFATIGAGPPAPAPKVEATEERLREAHEAGAIIEYRTKWKVISRPHWMDDCEYRIAGAPPSIELTEKRLIAALNTVKAKHGASCSPDGHANPEWYMAFKKELGL